MELQKWAPKNIFIETIYSFVQNNYVRVKETQIDKSTRKKKLNKMKSHSMV